MLALKLFKLKENKEPVIQAGSSSDPPRPVGPFPSRLRTGQAGPLALSRDRPLGGGWGRGEPELGGSWVLGPLAPSLASGEGSGHVVGADVAGDSWPRLCPRAVSTGLTAPPAAPDRPEPQGQAVRVNFSLFYS